MGVYCLFALRVVWVFDGVFVVLSFGWGWLVCVLACFVCCLCVAWYSGLFWLYVLGLLILAFRRGLWAVWFCVLLVVWMVLY